MDRAEKRQLREHIAQYLDISRVRLSDDDASLLKDLIDNWDQYKGRGRTLQSTWRSWSSDGRYTRTQTETESFTDTIGIRRDFAFTDDDGHSGEGYTELTDARAIINWFRSVGPAALSAFTDMGQPTTDTDDSTMGTNSTLDIGLSTEPGDDADPDVEENSDPREAWSIQRKLAVGASVAAAVGAAAVIATPRARRWVRDTSSRTTARLRHKATGRQDADVEAQPALLPPSSDAGEDEAPTSH